MKIIVIGSINKDIVLDVENVVSVGETISSYKQSEFIGGKGFNQAVAISKVFDDTSFYCNVNKNDIDVIETIKKQSFVNPYINLVDSNTGTAIIQVDKTGDNCIIVNGNANRELDLEHIDNILDEYGEEDYLVLQNETNDIDRIIGIAKEKGVRVVLNPSPITKNITKDLIEQVDILVLNQFELSDVTENVSLEDSLDYIKKNLYNTEIVLTFGPKGAMYLYKDEKVMIQSHEVDVVDTTCAGDTFLGYFVGYRANGFDVVTSMKYASKAASICIGVKGASVSIPNKDDVII